MTKYRIYELSARAVMSYAAEEYGQYMFRLNRTATEKCKIQTASHEQDSNALFFQIMCELCGNDYQEHSDGQITSPENLFLRRVQLMNTATSAPCCAPHTLPETKSCSCLSIRVQTACVTTIWGILPTWSWWIPTCWHLSV